jgi:hypothetical protein
MTSEWVAFSTTDRRGPPRDVSRAQHYRNPGTDRTKHWRFLPDGLKEWPSSPCSGEAGPHGRDILVLDRRLDNLGNP